MQITRDIETQKGPAEWFRGDVYIDAPIFVTEGVGLCQRDGGPIEMIHAGERVFFEPGEKHWHGAVPNRFMVHTAMQQNDESGTPVTWAEHVTDEEYRGAN
jgi:quercetin dioxygenase-like cupin family protein